MKPPLWTNIFPLCAASLPQTQVENQGEIFVKRVISKTNNKKIKILLNEHFVKFPMLSIKLIVLWTECDFRPYWCITSFRIWMAWTETITCETKPFWNGEIKFLTKAYQTSYPSFFQQRFNIEYNYTWFTAMSNCNKFSRKIRMF